MCSNPKSPFLVGLLATEKRAIVLKANCDTWECKECREHKKSQWVAHAITGSKAIISPGMVLNFVTITCHPKLKSFATTAAIFPHAWSLLYARMKREQAHFEYLMVMEQHKTGRLHAHILTSHQAKTRWMKDNCAKSGFGHQAKVRIVENEGQAAGYTAKYIGKSLGGQPLPPHFRRVRTSQGWEKAIEISRFPSDADWLACNTTTSLWAAVEECQAKNYAMIDGVTGEFFDYQDAVEHWY